VYRSFRDDYSRGLVEHLGVRGANKVFPDLVFSLDVAAYGMTNLPQEKTKTVALTALPYQKPGTWERPCMQAHEHYLDSLTRFACWLLNQGYAVDLVPMQMPMDGELATDLRHRVEMTLPNKSARLSITCPNGTFEEVMHQFAMASVVVTMRFHGVILPYLLGKPVLALSVHPKINELMKEFEQTRFCIDIEALTFDTVVEKFKELESVKNAASKLILHRVAINKTLLEKQYRELLRL
jgi:polysaccharide pyruvyl transferase WcaK-like protein